jgi:transcriptional regulator with XRE-family HTH domain
MARKTFGSMVRSLRETNGLKLRFLAEQTGISATYLSMLERNHNTTPPSEKVVFKLADVLGYDRDELLALTGRISTKVEKIILRHPREVRRLLLAIKGKRAEEINKWSERIERQSSKA